MKIIFCEKILGQKDLRGKFLEHEIYYTIVSKQFQSVRTPLKRKKIQAKIFRKEKAQGFTFHLKKKKILHQKFLTKKNFQKKRNYMNYLL